MIRARIFTAAAAVAAVLVVTASGSAQDAEKEPSLTRSAELVVAPAEPILGAPAGVPGQTARVVAGDLADAVPLPEGGTFDGVRWEQAGGDFTVAQIGLVLQHNAACQWLRAWRDGRQTPTSARVLADVPSWPAWRGSETGELMAQVAADVRAGGGRAADAMLADCDAAHERETAYATQHGLTPSR